MRVEKQELKDRTFIPYTITVTVESEEEHDKLSNQIRHAESHIRSAWGFGRIGRDMGIISDMFQQITSHTK